MMDDRNADLRLAARGAGISFIGNISFVVLNVLLHWLIARTLGPAKVGILGLAFNIIHITVVLGLFGMRDSAIRFIALFTGNGDPERAAGVIHFGLLLVLGASTAAAVLLLLGADLVSTGIFRKPELAGVLKILAFSVPPAALMMFFLAVTQGLKRMEYRTAIEKLAVPAVKIVTVLVGFWAFRKSTHTVASMILAASLAGGLLAAYVAWRLYPLRGKAARPVYEARALLSFTWPLLLTSLLDRSNIQTETLVLGALLASAQVGLYYVGQRATILITAIFLAFNAITAPMMADLYGRGEHDRLAGLFKTTTRWGASVCLPVLILFLTMSREMMAVFGEGFLAGAAVLQVLSVAQFINVLTGPAGWLLIMTGHPRLNLLNTCLSLALNIGFAFLLIPRLGILGAALGEATAIVLVNLLRLVEAQRILKIHPYQSSYWKPALAGLLSWAILAILKILLKNLNSFVQLGAAALFVFSLYPALLWALGFEVEDRLLIRAFLNRAGRGLRRPAAA